MNFLLQPIFWQVFFPFAGTHLTIQFI